MEEKDATPPKPSTDTSSDWARMAWTHLDAVRRRAPLVQCITNLVSMDIAANVLLASGASPAMIHSIHEIPDFTPKVDALYINIGTLSAEWVPAMEMGAKAAIEVNRPWVLDPVAVSVSSYRMEACLKLILQKPTVIRGNASEILALSSARRISGAKGADSDHESIDALDAAKSLAKSSGAVVAVSGAVDFITDGDRVISCSNGVQMMQKITATGCAVTALIAAFVAVDPWNALQATASALSVFGLAGELGMEMANGPASLRMHMVDWLCRLDEGTVTARVRLSCRS
ncbi:Hydroxyethylthiazole kinase family protein [Carex littledalei]|uniref:Hydroxyethylthiazole kinase n=1 Tax=Carex littledalei TaxID=544730 RepID=A0A833QZH9_9POAL|nr:Hydroxyethylthiazole kinase family protein [Carex littledalei]